MIIRKLTLGVSFLAVTGSFVIFQNFTSDTSIQKFNLDNHPAKIEPSLSEFEKIFNDPSSGAAAPINAPECQKFYDESLGDIKYNLNNLRNESSKSFGVKISNNSPSVRKIIFQPAGCVHKGTIDLAGDNLELNCNGGYLDGQEILGFIDAGVETLNKVGGASAIRIGKRFNYTNVECSEMDQNAGKCPSIINRTTNRTFEISLLVGNKIKQFAPIEISSLLVQKKNYYLVTDFAPLITYANELPKTGELASYRNELIDQFTTKNITVKNCKIFNYPGSGIDITWRIPANLKTVLIPKLEDRMNDWGTRDIKILNNNIMRMGNGSAYINDHVNNTLIEGNKFSATRGTAIYLDFHSHHNIVRKNSFIRTGYWLQEKADGSVNSIRKSREAIAIDGSVDNTIENNFFRDNAYGGIFLYKNCGEMGATKYPIGVPRELHASNNKIINNFFKNEEYGIWLAFRQEGFFSIHTGLFSDMAKARCSDPTPYTEKRTVEITDEFGNKSIEGPYNMFFKDFADYNEINGNTFQSVINGIVVADNHNTIINNKFYGNSKTLISVGTHRRNSLNPKEPVIGTKISNNESYVLPSEEAPLFNFYGHPEIAEFSNNKQIQGEALNKTCSPIIYNFLAEGEGPKSTRTCTFYPQKGDLSYGKVTTFADVTPVGTDGATYGSGDFYCDNGNWKPVKVSCKYEKRKKIVPFQFGVKGNNSGISKKLSCPNSKPILGIKALCNLEVMELETSLDKIHPIVESLNLNQVKVSRSSDIIAQGQCKFGNTIIQSGAKDLSIGIVKELEVSCKEQDADQGDCSVRGELVCEE